MLRSLYTLLLVCMWAMPALADNEYRKIAFYVVAHQDDWQLFMGDRVFADATDTNTKVVIIHTTAGDGSDGKQLNKQYYRARENGAINSIEFCADVHSFHRKNLFDTVEIAGHRLRRFSNKNIVNYFLLMPDGCFKTGWKGQSMEYLRKGHIGSIQTVDSNNIFHGWDDVVSTLRSVMSKEAEGQSNIHLNVADLDTLFNPGDHPDHIQSALAALQAVSGQSGVTVNLYVGYHSGILAPNLSTSAIALKGALYALADFGITQSNITTTWFNHQEFIDKTYFRTMHSGIEKLIGDYLGLAEKEVLAVHPNPAHERTFVQFRLEKDRMVKICLLDASGALKRLVLNERQMAGYHTQSIELGDTAPGLYFVSLETESGTQSCKLVVE